MVGLEDGATAEYIVTHDVTDHSELEASCEQRITVVDREPPMLVCPFDTTVEVGSETNVFMYQYNAAVDAGHTVSDNSVTPAPSIVITRSYNAVHGEDVSTSGPVGFELVNGLATTYTMT